MELLKRRHLRMGSLKRLYHSCAPCRRIGGEREEKREDNSGVGDKKNTCRLG
jgi:hypothetical protein